MAGRQVMRGRAVAYGLLLLAAMPARAEIEKLATSCESICFHWWPKLPELTDWHHERGPSLEMGCNALAPDGSTFSDAEVVMYAMAVYKPRVPEHATLEEFIVGDRERFVHDDPELVVAEAETLSSADGQVMKSLTFFPGKEKKGNWERVTYGEEGEFYLTFTISSRSPKGFEVHQAAYEKLVKSYRK